MSLDEGVPVVTKRSAECLTERQTVDYEMHREDLLEWLSHFGKRPQEAEGYSRDTVIRTAYRLDQLYRWVWEQEGYTTNISQEHADGFLREVATSGESQTHKSNVRSSLLRLFKWKVHEQGAEPWEPEFSFSEPSRTTQPRLNHGTS